MIANITKDNVSHDGMGNDHCRVEDYFGYVFEDITSFNLKVFAWALTQFIGNPLMLGLIAYKKYGSLNYQTLIDKLLVYFYSACLAYNLTGTNCDFLRTFVKLPRIICIVYIVQLNTLCMALCLTALEIHVLRYLYICVWKNVGKLNDDFFGHFFVILNSIIIFFETSLVVLTQEYINFELALCEGSNPDTILQNKNIPWGQFFTVGSITVCCLACLVLNLLIYLHNKRESLHKEPNSHKEVPGQIKAKLFDMERLFECALILSLIAAIAPYIYVRWSYDSGRLSSVSPLMLMAASSVLNVTLFFLWPLSTYARNSVLRRHTWRSLSETQFGCVLCQIISRARERITPQQIQCL